MALIWDIVSTVYTGFLSVRHINWHRSQWQTTWDRKKLFTSLVPSAPIKFVAPGPIGSADIVVNERAVYQPIAGFGASLSNYLHSFRYLVWFLNTFISGYICAGTWQSEGMSLSKSLDSVCTAYNRHLRPPMPPIIGKFYGICSRPPTVPMPLV